jgi:hypothetical protein
MTTTGDNSNKFNTRADSAALSLRQGLLKKGAEMPESASVEVGPDGKPPAPPPPEGSYARMAQDAAREQAQQIGDQPPVGTPEQVLDGSQAPPLTHAPPPDQSAPESPSPRAQQRIQDLIDQLREKERAIQQLETTTSQNQELQAKLQNMEQQYQQVVQANLDNLDPDTRMQVLHEARTRELLAGFKSELLNEIGPQLRTLESKAARDEMQALSDVYPAFDLKIHGTLIDTYRGANPNSSIEQAYKAIAVGDELVTREQASATAVPPVLPPGNGSLQNVRYAPQSQPQESDPQQEINELSSRFAKLRGSDDPVERKQGMDMLSELLNKRLSR